MSVKKEREAEFLMARREQRSGEVICIDDWIWPLPTSTCANRLGRTSACKRKHKYSFRTHIHAHAPANLQFDEWTQSTLSITTALLCHFALQLLQWNSDTHIGLVFPNTQSFSQQLSRARSTFIQSPIMSLAPLDAHNLHACGITFAELHTTPNDLFSNSMYLTISSLVKQNAHALSCARTCTVQSLKRTLIVC